MKIVVEDSGVGIDTLEQENLFKAFTKIQHNRELNKDGVGLGLVMSKNIARALGGDIEFHSEKGKGSKFILILPLPREDSRMILQQQDSGYNLIGDSTELFQDSIEPYIPQYYSMHPQFPTLHYDEFQQPEISIESIIQDIEVPASHFIEPHRNIQMIESNFQAQRRQNNLIVNQLPLYHSGFCKCGQILIVDDDTFNLITLEGMIKQVKPDIAVDKAMNGQEALNMIQQNQSSNCHQHFPYKMMFIDNNMPLMDGVQCAQQLRHWQEQGIINRDLQIILVSGDEHLLRNKTIIQLFNTTFRKPINKRQLSEVLQQL